MSHHDHDFKKNVWTPFLDEVTAISQRHGANPPVGCKSVKELQPLAFFFSLHIYLIASESMHLDQERHDTGRQARLYHEACEAPQTRLASIQQICTCFSFLQKKEGTIGGGCVWIA
jgi:hypothetical protein